MRIAVGGLHHETNSFAPQPATFARFEEADGWPPLCVGEEIFTHSEGANLAVAGFIAEARRQGHELVPLLWANACPSGPVEEEAYERLVGMLLERLADAMPVDGLFLDLHGAMVTTHLDDGEGELLERIRARHPDLPIVCALDLHANVSDRMVAHADALVAYRTYPHVDLADTGARCLPLLVRRVESGRPLASFHAKLDYLVPLPWQSTDLEPAAGLYREVALRERPGALVPSLCLGFPLADSHATGPSVLVFGDPGEEVEETGRALVERMRASEPHFHGRWFTIAEAVERAVRHRADRPLILADAQDNPGGGGSSDTTDLLKALVERRVEGVAAALLWDPEAAARAHQAGVGAVLSGLALGGRHGPPGVTPLIADLRVLALGSGRFEATGPMYRGNRMDLGPMALLAPTEAPGVKILVASRRMQAADRSLFRHLGVEPERERVLVLKSSAHFRADFAPIAAEILVVEAPGWVITDTARLPYRRLPQGLRHRPRSA